MKWFMKWYYELIKYEWGRKHALSVVSLHSHTSLSFSFSLSLFSPSSPLPPHSTIFPPPFTSTAVCVVCVFMCCMHVCPTRYFVHLVHPWGRVWVVSWCVIKMDKCDGLAAALCCCFGGSARNNVRLFNTFFLINVF